MIHYYYSFTTTIRLLEHVQSTSETTLIYALGAVQNICSIDVDFARECQGQHPILEWLKARPPPPLLMMRLMQIVPRPIIFEWLKARMPPATPHNCYNHILV